MEGEGWGDERGTKELSFFIREDQGIGWESGRADVQTYGQLKTSLQVGYYVKVW